MRRLPFRRKRNSRPVVCAVLQCHVFQIPQVVYKLVRSISRTVRPTLYRRGRRCVKHELPRHRTSGIERVDLGAGNRGTRLLYTQSEAFKRALNVFELVCFPRCGRPICVPRPGRLPSQRFNYSSPGQGKFVDEAELMLRAVNLPQK